MTNRQTKNMRILVSAFEPFDKDGVNYSLEVLKKLEENQGVFYLVLPVEYFGSFKLIKKEIERIKPNYVIMLGESRSYSNVGFETIGINEFGKHPDNINYIPESQRIIDNGEDGIFSTLDYDLFKKSFDNKDVKQFKSFSAGTYVCNALMYQVLKYIQMKKKNIKAGFIHVPDIAKQSIGDIVEGLNNYINNILKLEI